MKADGARELGSAQVVRSFRSQVRGPRFGREGSRVGDIEQEASRGRLGSAYDPERAYQLSVVAGWAYADGQTLADKIQHYGFEAGAYVQQFSVINEAMLVVARAYLVRSKDGRAGILAFRGTEPVNAINWLTNAHTEARPFYGRGVVHHGFHTNLEALWSYIDAALREAIAGGSAPGNGAAAGTSPPLQRLEHLYVTGHSLGGAMAVLAAARIFRDGDLASFRPLVRGVYTFGQPLVGDRSSSTRAPIWASSCTATSTGTTWCRCCRRRRWRARSPTWDRSESRRRRTSRGACPASRPGRSASWCRGWRGVGRVLHPAPAPAAPPRRPLVLDRRPPAAALHRHMQAVAHRRAAGRPDRPRRTGQAHGARRRRGGQADVETDGARARSGQPGWAPANRDHPRASARKTAARCCRSTALLDVSRTPAPRLSRRSLPQRL